MSRQSGLTLVELLVTMTILAMIVVIGTTSFSVFAQRWSGELGSFNASVSRARDSILVQEVLDSLVPWVAYDNAGKPFVYFEGNRNGFVAVSSRSMYSAGDYAVVRLSVVQNSDTRFDVLYEEWPMSNDILLSTRQKINFSEVTLLYASVNNPVFEYMGSSPVEEIDDFSGLYRSSKPEWLQSYNAMYSLTPPLRARLSFEVGEYDFQISSSLSSPVPGLLSRYKPYRFRSPSSDDVEELDDLDGLDDCDC